MMPERPREANIVYNFVEMLCLKCSANQGVFGSKGHKSVISSNVK